MKRLTHAVAVALTLALVAAFAASGSSKTAAVDGLRVLDEQGERGAWTNLAVNNRKGTFQFAVVSDRTGGHRPGVFPRAVRMINMLQPEFVMSVGDLIEGYTDDPGQWALEWSEFEAKLDALEMPFFFCAGNHDISNVPMSENWKRKFGRTYYSFRYQDVLFLVLNSEEPRPRDEVYKFGPEQQQWLTQTLDRNRDVRWTFVFFHKPVWDLTKSDPTAQGWTAVEGALRASNRPFTVFVGHEHNYMKFVREGREYYMLATTGGASRLRGAEFGEFDHVAWVTMKEKAPVVANVLLDGVQPNDIATMREPPRSPALLSPGMRPGAPAVNGQRPPRRLQSPAPAPGVRQ